MRRKILLSLLVVFILTGQIVLAGSNSVSTMDRTVEVKGRKVRFNQVTVNLNDKDIYLEVVTGNDRIKNPENFNAMVNRKKPVAAINANFFESYSNNKPIGNIINDGSFLYEDVDGTVNFISTYSGEYAIGEYFFHPQLFLDGKKQDILGDNGQAMDENIINLFRRDVKVIDRLSVRSDKVDLEGRLGIVVDGGRVTGLMKNKKALVIPKEGFIISLGLGDPLKDQFRIGRLVDYQLNAVERGGMDSPKTYRDVRTAITVWPRLVEDKKSIQDINDGPSPKQRAQRSALGITENKRLLLITAPGLTLDELANLMEKIGCVDAMNLDGGASSALYGKGRYIKNPGRRLHTVLMVHDRGSKK